MNVYGVKGIIKLKCQTDIRPREILKRGEPQQDFVHH
jgi:hypothetical protein